MPAENENVETAKRIGSVIDANIANDVIKIKLEIPAEDAAIGVPHIVEGSKYIFYCISTNIVHDFQPIVMKLANNMDYSEPIDHTRSDSGTMEPVEFPAVMEISCLKAVRKDGASRGKSIGFKSIPKLFSEARVATQADIQAMTEGLAKPGDSIGSIGHFLGTEFKMPLNLTELFRVPFGIFGKTSSGKTITAKTLLIRALSQGCYVDNRPVRFIIFDAQGEYARGIGSSGNLGLFQYVPNELYQLSIDPQSTTPASTSPLYIDPGELTVFDWLNAFWDYTGNMEALLKEMDKDRRAELVSNGPSPTNTDLAVYANHFPDTYGSYPQYTVNAVWRRMQKFNEPEFRRFLMKPPSGHDHVMKTIWNLVTSGKSIIVHFGRYGLDTSVYMFVTNYITRKLYEKYTLSVNDTSNTLPQTVLLIEEAGKFIPAQSLGFTGSSYLGKICRQTRKFGLVAGFIDQRPSKLDDEVVSQLGSRFIHCLDDPDDVKAALAGLNKQKWLAIVSKLTQGETAAFGNVVDGIPTMIKPFWRNRIQDVKEFFNITAITPEMLSQPTPSPRPDTNASEPVDVEPEIVVPAKTPAKKSKKSVDAPAAPEKIEVKLNGNGGKIKIDDIFDDVPPSEDESTDDE